MTSRWHRPRAIRARRWAFYRGLACVHSAPPRVLLHGCFGFSVGAGANPRGRGGRRARHGLNNDCTARPSHCAGGVGAKALMPTGDGFHIVKGFGVGQSGEAVHSAVQAGIADNRPRPVLGLQCSGAAAAVGAQPPSSGIRPTFFTFRCTKGERRGGRGSPGWASRVLAGRDEITQPGDI